MFKQFCKSAVILLLVFFITSSVYASGKMEVALGETVTLQAEALQGGSTYKWVVKQGRDIIGTQATSLFSYTFDVQGEYNVSLTVTDQAGAIKSTTVDVLVGNRYSAPSGSGTSSNGGAFSTTPLKVDIQTLPITTSQQTVHIAGNEGRVAFDIGTRPDILEYRIDRNVYIDSDGNGIANDDIDNDDHSSYLLGGVWQTLYKASESNKIAAEVTVVNTQGQKAKTQVEIIFGSSPAKEGNVVAILDTLPGMDATAQKIYVYGEKDTVAFYARRSQGDIIEYRIDKNIFVDSDSDGNPANDIDNRNDTSFKTGDVWTTEYSRSDEQVIAQLIVVGSGGTGSRIQREIVFTDAPEVDYEETVSTEVPTIQLVADKEFVQKGDPVSLSVTGLVQTLDRYTFEWDFDGDGIVDQTVEGDNAVSYIYDEAAIYPVKVKVMDHDGNEASFTMDLLVKDITSTKADFEYEIDGLTVNFTNLSVTSPNLTSQILNYTWAFGDSDSESYEAQKDKIGVQNPSYTYTQPGTHIVTLTVVDSDQVTDTKSQEVFLDTPEGFVDSTDGEEANEVISDEKSGGSLIGGIFKVILYIILIVVVLFILIVFGLLVFLKIQHPDLVFEELVDELKIKILSMMGVHDMIVPVATATKSEVKPETPKAPTQSPQTSAPVEDLSKSDAPMPEWLKPKNTASASSATNKASAKANAIEGEVLEDVVTPAPKPQPKPTVSPTDGSADLNKADGPVPDWLKPS